MNIIKTAIEGLVIIEPRLFKDDRGYFFESFSQKEFNEKVTPLTFVQDNESQSCYGVIRGLHFQKPPYTQSKLVRVIKGCVLDVAVDIRKNSPTFGQHVAVELTGENHLQFFIPKGFAHGFAVLSEEAVFQALTGIDWTTIDFQPLGREEEDAPTLDDTQSSSRPGDES